VLSPVGGLVVVDGAMAPGRIVS